MNNQKNSFFIACLCVSLSIMSATPLFAADAASSDSAPQKRVSAAPVQENKKPSSTTYDPAQYYAQRRLAELEQRRNQKAGSALEQQAQAVSQEQKSSANQSEEKKQPSESSANNKHNHSVSPQSRASQTQNNTAPSTKPLITKTQVTSTRTYARVTQAHANPDQPATAPQQPPIKEQSPSKKQQSYLTTSKTHQPSHAPQTQSAQKQQRFNRPQSQSGLRASHKKERKPYNQKKRSQNYFFAGQRAFVEQQKQISRSRILAEQERLTQIHNATLQQQSAMTEKHTASDTQQPHQDPLASHTIPLSFTQPFAPSNARYTRHQHPTPVTHTPITQMYQPYMTSFMRYQKPYLATPSIPNTIDTTHLTEMLDNLLTSPHNQRDTFEAWNIVKRMNTSRITQVINNAYANNKTHALAYLLYIIQWQNNHRAQLYKATLNGDKQYLIHLRNALRQIHVNDHVEFDQQGAPLHHPFDIINQLFLHHHTPQTALEVALANGNIEFAHTLITTFPTAIKKIAMITPLLDNAHQEIIADNTLYNPLLWLNFVQKKHNHLHDNAHFLEIVTIMAPIPCTLPSLLIPAKQDGYTAQELLNLYKKFNHDRLQSPLTHALANHQNQFNAHDIHQVENYEKNYTDSDHEQEEKENSEETKE